MVRDLTGIRMGKLVAEERVVHNGRFRWQCLCDCGKRTWVLAQNFTSGRTKSCGCLIKDIIDARRETTVTWQQEYKVWHNLIHRASKEVYIDPLWLESYHNFINDVGRKLHPKSRLCRRDISKGFYKDNCYWRYSK